MTSEIKTAQKHAALALAHFLMLTDPDMTHLKAMDLARTSINAATKIIELKCSNQPPT